MMKTTRYELNIIRPDLTAGTVRLAFLTDLHNVENGPENQLLLQAIKEADPDFILCGGDMLIGKKDNFPKTAIQLMEALLEDYPVYHALGNHETRLKCYPHQYGPIYQEYSSAIQDAGVILLDSASELITVRGIPLQISGYTLPLKYYKHFKNYTLDASEITEELGLSNPNALNILMGHHPQHMRSYVNWGADLTLCGHYHGGMIRIGEHTGLITPNYKLFNDQCYGQYDFNARIKEGYAIKCSSHVIVGAGLGEHTIPLRLNNPRELVIVDISIAKEW